MRNTNQIAVVALSLILSACSGAMSTNSQSTTALSNTGVNETTAQPEQRLTPPVVTKTLTIKHHQIECEGFQIGHCFLAKEGDGPWKFFYDQIEGFDFQWGIESKILVQVNDGSALTADMSSGYRLMSVLSTSDHKKGTSFDYVARGGHDGIARTGEQQYTLRGDKAFSCAQQDCDNIDSLLSQQKSVLLSFSHSTAADAPLVLKAVLCADAPGAFFRSCEIPDYSS